MLLKIGSIQYQMTMSEEPLPEGVFSLLDTDLYKLTMQCAILKYFPDVCESLDTRKMAVSKY